MRPLAFAVFLLILAPAAASAKGIGRAEVCDRHGCVDVAPAQAFLHGGAEHPEPAGGEEHYLRVTMLGEGGTYTAAYRDGLAQAGDGSWYALRRHLVPIVDVAAVSIVPTVGVLRVLGASAT